MLRAERITGLDRVRDEIEVYSSLIAEPRQLSATLLLEIEDQVDLRVELLKFLGVDEAVFSRPIIKIPSVLDLRKEAAVKTRSARASTCGSRWEKS